MVELFGDTLKYMIVENRLLEALRMRWQHDKMSNLEYYIVNISNQCWHEYKEKSARTWHHHPNMKIYARDALKT